MKAAVLHGPRDIRVEKVGNPVIKANEVLLKVKACGICGTDLHAYRTGKSRNRILGHEFSGEVVEVGLDIKGVGMGDRVVGTGFTRDGGSLKVPGEGLDGAFAEYVVIPNPMMGQMFFRVPEGLSWEVAATIEPVSVACYFINHTDLQAKDTVVVLGAGMVGLCITQVCKALGISKVIVSEPSLLRRLMAAELGADVVIDPTAVDPVDVVARATDGKKAKVIFECSGNPAAFSQAPYMARFGGMVMQIGFTERQVHLSPDLVSMMIMKNITLRYCGGQKWDQAVELMATGKVKTEKLITKIIPLDEADLAFETQLKANDIIKVIIKP
jgi:2-desacetyl-2-hydroxyethyl bacteriochlorophyllide A dehydrogenase